MKKIISFIMFILIETLTIVMVMKIYQSQKAILTANEVFDNTIVSLQSRNFSNASIEAIERNKTYQFHIKKFGEYRYEVTMDFDVQFQSDKKTIKTYVYKAK